MRQKIYYRGRGILKISKHCILNMLTSNEAPASLLYIGIWILNGVITPIGVPKLELGYKKSIEEGDFKDKFEVVSGFPFPVDGEITRVEGCDPFGASDYYHCGGRFMVNRPTYNMYEEVFDKNSSTIHYKVGKSTGEWGFHTQSTIYFHYFEE